MSDTSIDTSVIDRDIASVQEANTVFYKAFETLDIQKMDKLWLQDDHVKCVHPGWEICSGWPDVRDSWVLIFNHTHEITFSVSLLDTRVKEDLAWVVCNETIATRDNGKWLEGRVLSTNIFERRDGIWLLVHHHGSPVLATGNDDKGEESDTP